MHLRMKPIIAGLLCFVALAGCARRSSIRAPVGGIVLRSERIALPYHGREFAGGPQAAVANTYCLMCHSGGMVLTQPPLALSDWKAELNKMKKAYGCPLPESDIDELAPFVRQASLGGAPPTQ
jgi:hypothetical protein